MTLTQSLEFRRAVPSFDPEASLTREKLLELMNRANLAPSSMNLQPWAFLIAETPEDKERLKRVSFNQGKLTEASMALVVFGNLDETTHMEWVVDQSIEVGFFTEERRERFYETVRKSWADPQKARDEAFRASSIWSMAFMLVAAEEGWDAAPMGGYDAAALKAEFNVPENLVPTLVLAIGKRNPSVPLFERRRIKAEDLLVPTS